MATITLSPALAERVEREANSRGENAEIIIMESTESPDDILGPTTLRNGDTISLSDGIKLLIHVEPQQEEDSPEVLAAIAEAQAVAVRINLRLDSIHSELQAILTDLRASVLGVREAHETAAAIRQVTEAGNPA